jgi:hypothetical protein
MSTTKRVSGDFNLITVDTDANVLITTHTLHVDGNLRVTGSTTEVNVEQTTIQDPIITLGSGNDGSLVELGIEVVKSPGFKAGLRWNSNGGESGQWEISSDNSTWFPIAVTTAVFRVEDDPSPTLGGDLNTNGYRIESPVGDSIILSAGNRTVEIENSLKIPYRTVAPSAEANYTKVYARPVGAGGSGLYTTTLDSSSVVVQDELVSRAKAIIYSIIF